jgi:periplasmic protein TonB
MKNFLLTLLCFICIAKSYGQTGTNSYGRVDVEITKEKKPKRVYTKVEIKSAFPCGDSSWVRSLENKLNQSVRADRRVKKGKYVVSVQFIVSKDSSISDVRCINCPGFGMSAEVVMAIKKCTKWRPAPYPGHPVKPYRTSSTTRQESN